jgi:RND family efflux transporter MFP subunit
VNWHRTYLGLLALGAALACTACNEAKSAPTLPTPVRTATVQELKVGNAARYSASIVPYTQVDLAFKSNGYVDRILQVKSVDGGMRNIDQGDWVKRGTVLALVQQQDYLDKLQQAKAQLSRSEAEYQKAKLSFDRTSTLYAAQAATKPDLDNAQAQLDSTTASVSSSKAQISEAQVALDYCSLRAPFDGWIVKRSVDIGSLVGPATNGFTIADTRSVKAVFGIPDTSIGSVKRGQLLTVTTDAVPGNFQGRVTTISAAADQKSRVYAVEVTIPNGKDLLKSGMIATLAVGADAMAKSVLGVPLEAVIRDPSQPNSFAVLVADPQGDAASVHLRRVEIGDAYGNMVAVRSGLSANEQVITTGASMVKDGDSVRILQ